MRKIVFCIAVCLCGLLIAYTANFFLSNPAEAQLAFEPRVVIRRSLPAITDAPNVPASVADQTVHDAELVLGVSVNGKARAYPINMLTGPRREIINDKLGGTAIAATW